MTAARILAGIDLGGTNLKAGLIDESGSIILRRNDATNLANGPEALVREMGSVIQQLLAEMDLSRENLHAIGVGSPGPLSPSQGQIIHAGNLPGWKDVKLVELMRRDFHLPVWLENDANAATYGEYWVGAARGAKDVTMMTLGTGIGVGAIVNGELLRGHFENAVEMGHMIVALEGLPCSCGQRGCLECYASAAAVARRVVTAIQDGEPSSLSEAVASGQEITSKDVVQAVAQGDGLCERIWDDATRYLAIACINIQHAYNPTKIVFGGGMARAGDMLFDRVKKHFRDQQWMLHDDFPEIVPGLLGDDAGIIGAAGLGLRAVG